jgi:CRISPR-associated protein Cmr3
MSFSNSTALAALIATISQLPPEWALTPCVGKKNLWPAWNTSRLDRSVLIDAIANQRNHAGHQTAWTGVSLITGPMSGGVMAIDFDGEAALEKYEALSGGNPLLVSRMWTSGKPGHFQILLRVPQAQWRDLKPVKLELRDGHKLEFRWNQCSTLPPSIHPDTKSPYYWENWDESYDWQNWEEFVPIAPDWAISLMRGSQQPPATDTRELSQILLDDILPRLDAESFYSERVKLKKAGKNLVGLCPFHDEKTGSFTVSPDTKLFKCFGCDAGGGPVQFLHQIGGGSGSPSGKAFVEVVRQLGDRVGVKIPDRAGDRPANRAESPKQQKQPIDNNKVSLHSEPVNLRAEVQKIYDSNLTGSRLSEAILKLAKNGNSKEIWRLYYEIAEEIETEETRAERSTEVLSLLSIGERRFALSNCLHPSLAEPINKVASWMGVDPESVLTHLLPITAGLIDPHSRIIAKECINFAEPFLLYSGVSALSGSRKTPLLNVVKAPLVAFQAWEDLRHSEALKQYEEEFQEFKKSKNNDNPPPEPPKPPREFYVDNITTESIDKIKGQQPDCGLSLIKDELSGLFASHGAYKGGKGSDKESFLSGWNGGGIKKNRCSDDSRVSLSHDSLSITGGIQPDKIRSLLGDFTDAQGEWARFLWYHQPMRPYKIPRNNCRYDLGELLQSIYRKILDLPVLKLRFDRQGQTYFDDWHDEKDEHKRRETKPGLQAAIAKMPGQAVRLIGLLHVLWEIAEGNNEVRATVPLEIVKAGCDLAEFYLGQVTKLQSDGEVPEPTPIFTALLEKTKEVGSLTASQAKKAIWCLRKTTPDKIRQIFQELAQMGLASIEGAGCKLKLVSKELRDFLKMPASTESLPQPLESLTNSEESVPDRPAVDRSEGMGFDGCDRDNQPQPFEIDQAEQLAEIEGNFEEAPTSHNSISPSTTPAETLLQQDSESVEEFWSSASVLPEVEEEDAAKMRDIAVVWWPEMYPDALQSLVAQMFGWGAPARKYSAVQIAQWLQGEDDLVKYRIGELMAIGLADSYENDEEE